MRVSYRATLQVLQKPFAVWVVPLQTAVTMVGPTIAQNMYASTMTNVPLNAVTVFVILIEVNLALAVHVTVGTVIVRRKYHMIH